MTYKIISQFQRTYKTKLWRKTYIKDQLRIFAISMLEMKEHVEKFYCLSILQNLYKYRT